MHFILLQGENNRRSRMFSNFFNKCQIVQEYPNGVNFRPAGAVVSPRSRPPHPGRVGFIGLIHKYFIR